MTPLLGFMPDAPAGTKGAIVECTNIVPTFSGIAPGPGESSAAIGSPLGFNADSAVLAKNTRGAARFIVASTAGAIYEATTGGLSSVSSLALGSSGMAFASFGDVILAASKDQNVAISTYGSGNPPSTATPFTAASGAPKANILVAAKNFVLAFDTDDALFGVSSDRWWCSAFQDAASWTINPVTQANSGRLVGIPGRITAAAMLGETVVAYKETGAYLGREAGPPYSWQWDDVESHFGCAGKRALCDVDGSHFVVGVDDVWMFDGVRPVSVAEGKIRDWLFKGVNGVAPQISVSYRHKTTCVYERDNSRVWMFYVPSGSTTGVLEKAVVYSVRTGRWGKADRVVQCAFPLVNAVGVHSHLGAFPFYSNAIGVVMAPSGTAGTYVISDNNFVTPATSSFDVADVGDDFAATYVRSVRLRYTTPPATASAQGFTREELTGVSTPRQTALQNGGRFNMTQDGRWHWFRFILTGAYETSAYAIDSRDAGRK